MNNKKKIDDNQKVAEIIVIKEFIEQKSKENYKGYYSDKNIREARETLKRCKNPHQMNSRSLLEISMPTWDKILEEVDKLNPLTYLKNFCPENYH